MRRAATPARNTSGGARGGLTYEGAHTVFSLFRAGRSRAIAFVLGTILAVLSSSIVLADGGGSLIPH